MAKDKVAKPENKAEAPAQDKTAPLQDEFTGQGGSYTYDPETKTRTRNPD